MKISMGISNKKSIFTLRPFVIAMVFSSLCFADELTLNEKDYFEMQGLNVTVFSDIYPDGHQTGVTVIQHGSRVAANGDLRLEISPGQWSPVPVGGKQTVDKKRRRLRNHFPTQTRVKIAKALIRLSIPI